MKKNSLSIFGLLFVFCLAVFPVAPAGAATWNLVSDFSSANTTGSAWSFGWMEAPDGTLTVYNTLISNAVSSPQWYDSAHSSGDLTPTVWKNTDSNNNWGVAPGEVSVHPGWDGSFSVVRWTADASGSITVSGSFGAGDSGAMSYYIYENGVLKYQWINYSDTASFYFTETVAAGTTIDFIVGINTYGYGYGNTPLTVNISSVPLPAAAWFLGSGLLGLCGLRRKFLK